MNPTKDRPHEVRRNRCRTKIQSIRIHEDTSPIADSFYPNQVSQFNRAKCCQTNPSSTTSIVAFDLCGRVDIPCMQTGSWSGSCLLLESSRFKTKQKKRKKCLQDGSATGDFDISNILFVFGLVSRYCFQSCQTATGSINTTGHHDYLVQCQ